VHQVGFSSHDYIEMHGQQNIKKILYYIAIILLFGGSIAQ